jgi:hypothetical protein
MAKGATESRMSRQPDRGHTATKRVGQLASALWSAALLATTFFLRTSTILSSFGQILASESNFRSASPASSAPAFQRVEPSGRISNMW